MQRILLLGYFGAGNFGDDALLVDWLKHNRTRLLENQILTDIICDGQDPLAGFVEGDDLKALIGKLIPKREALKLNPNGYKFLLAPGGSLLQDATSVRSLVYYLWLIRKFTTAKRQVYLLNQGLGPLHSWVAYFFTPRILAGISMLSLRDSQSFEWCKSTNSLKEHKQLIYSADPIIKADFQECELPASIKDKEYALFIPRQTEDLPSPIDDTTEAQAMAELIKHCEQTTALEQVLLPLHPETDMAFCIDIARNCDSAPTVLDHNLLGTHPMTAVWTIIRNAKLVVSHRLHGVISAASAGVPALGVAYDPKVQAFCNEVALPYCFPATVHETQAKDDLRRLWNDRESVQDEMSLKLETMKNRLNLAQEQFNEVW